MRDSNDQKAYYGTEKLTRMQKQYEPPLLEEIGTVEKITGANTLSGGDGAANDPLA